MGIYKPTDSHVMSVVSMNLADAVAPTYISNLDKGLLAFPQKAPIASVESLRISSQSSTTSSEGNRPTSLVRNRTVLSKSSRVWSARPLTRRATSTSGPTPPSGCVFGVALGVAVDTDGVPLTTFDAVGEQISVPVLVEECVRFITSNVENSSADFVPGESARINSLRQTFGSGHSNSGRAWASCNPQDASSLLCAYLYELPEPVIPFSSYAAFRAPIQVKAASPLNTPVVISTYQALISQLPPAHRHLLLYLLDLLATLRTQDRVAFRNILAIRLAPAILRSRQKGFGSKMRELMLAGDDSVPILLFLMNNQAHFPVLEGEFEDGEMEEATIVNVIGATRQHVHVVDVQKRRRTVIP